MALFNHTARTAVAVEDILMLMDNSTGNATNATVAVPHYPSGYTLPQIVVASIVVTIIMIVVVVGNMLVIIAITTEKALKNIQNWFIASLAVADFFLGLVIMPFSLANELMGYWIFGAWWCDIHSAMDVLLSTASIMNLCLISLDRYWSITQAVEYLKKRTPLRAIVMITAVWLLSALICIPPLLGWKVERTADEQYPKCQVPNTEAEWRKIETGFSAKWNFPQCVDALDGKHILIRNPVNAGSDFFNYKGTYSIVLLALVDADYCFTYVNMGAQGRASDGSIFSESSLYQKLENFQLNRPSKSDIVADDAFPLKPYLMKPYARKNLTMEQKIFNYRLSRTRRISANAFGILVAEFRIFESPIALAPAKTTSVVKVTTALHNWLRIQLLVTFIAKG